MLALKYLLVILGLGLFGSAGALVVYDIYISEQLRRLLQQTWQRDGRHRSDSKRRQKIARIPDGVGTNSICSIGLR